MINDPIADMLTRIRNAMIVQKSEIVLPFSKIKFEILRVLQENGYIKNFSQEIENQKKNLKVQLKYKKDGSSVIKSLKRISKLGRRVYSSKKIFKIYNKNTKRGILIISTSQGILTDKEAKKKNIGGEVMCEIY